MKDIIAKAVERGFDYNKHQYENNCMFSPSDLFFSHDFLRAFFRVPYEGKIGIICRGDDSECGFEEVGEYWEFHAQQLVLSEDRLEYLRRFL